jgi:hypothetical protein
VSGSDSNICIWPPNSSSTTSNIRDDITELLKPREEPAPAPAPVPIAPRVRLLAGVVLELEVGFMSNLAGMTGCVFKDGRLWELIKGREEDDGLELILLGDEII